MAFIFLDVAMSECHGNKNSCTTKFCFVVIGGNDVAVDVVCGKRLDGMRVSGNELG